MSESFQSIHPRTRPHIHEESSWGELKAATETQALSSGVLVKHSPRLMPVQRRSQAGARSRADSSSGTRPPQADQGSASIRTTFDLQPRRRSNRLAQQQQELLLHHEDHLISEATAKMQAIRRTYPRNDTGPRAADSRDHTRRRRESVALSLALRNLGAELPTQIGLDTRINMQFAVTSNGPNQLRHINPQTLVAVASLVDTATGGPASTGTLASVSTSARARPVQAVGPTFEMLFQDLSIRKPGIFRVRVSLLRMPEASTVGGHAAHVAEWESKPVRVRSRYNGA